MRTPLTVVVPTRDRPEMLDRCLDAVTAVLGPGDEIVVADSASRDPTVAEIALARGARVVRCERPGASRARNAGAAVASHDVIAFVDDDCLIQPGWADAVTAPFADPGVAFVSGRVTLPPSGEGYRRPVALNEGDEVMVLDRSTPKPRENSGNVAVRRSTLDAVGGFDEAMGGGAPFHAAEDLDLFDRMFAAGLAGRYEPAAVAWHEQWRNRRQLVALDWRYGFGSGARLSKLVRRDRTRARMVLREVVWRTDVLPFLRVVRAWEEFAILLIGLRIAGTAAGLVSGLTRPLGPDGRFSPLRASRGSGRTPRRPAGRRG